MAEILIRDIREVVISSAITPIKDDLLKERQELQRQRSSSEPYQAEVMTGVNYLGTGSQAHMEPRAH